MKTSQKKPLSRTDRLELAQRHFEGSSKNALKNRFRVSESDVDKVVQQFQAGSLFKRHRNWQPHYDKENTIHHPTGKDAMRSLQSGNGEDPFLSPLDPDLDVANGLLHLRWTNDDVNDLLYGMLKRSFTILKEGKPNTTEYQEEVSFLQSGLFQEICNHLGLDADELKSTFDYKTRHHNKPTSLDARLAAHVQELLN